MLKNIVHLQHVSLQYVVHRGWAAGRKVLGKGGAYVTWPGRGQEAGLSPLPRPEKAAVLPSCLHPGCKGGLRQGEGISGRRVRPVSQQTQHRRAWGPGHRTTSRGSPFSALPVLANACRGAGLVSPALTPGSAGAGGKPRDTFILLKSHFANARNEKKELRGRKVSQHCYD